MTHRPLLVFTCCWVLGSGTACMYSGFELMYIIVGISLLLAVVLYWRRAGAIFICSMVLSLFMSSGYWEWNDARNVSTLSNLVTGMKEEDETIAILAEGVILSPVKVDGDRADFEFLIKDMDTYDDLKKEKVQVQVKLMTQEEQQAALHWRRGDVASIVGQLEKPGIARNFQGFDYQQFLRTKEIHWLLKVRGIDQIEVAEPEEWTWSHLFRWNDQVREFIGGHIDQLFSGVHAGYMKGLIIGEKGDLDADTFGEFSRLGLTHILAISGMHVAVYVGSLLFIFSACRFTRESSLTAVIFLLPLYVLLTGASPSVVRAGIMGMIGLYAARRGLLKDGLHILNFTALIMLLWDPYFLVNISFQLSFLVTAGLMVFVPKLTSFLSFLPRWLAGTVGVTLAAQLVSFPLTIYYFNQFSLLSLLANLFLVPLISLVVLPMGMITVILGMIWPTCARWIAILIEWLNASTFSIVEWMNSYPLFLTIWPSPTLWWIHGYFIVLYLLLHIVSNKKGATLENGVNLDETVPLSRGDMPKRLHSISLHPVANKLRSMQFYRFAHHTEKLGSSAMVTLLACLFLFLLYSGYHGPGRQGDGWVQFLDVGQGDSILVSTPDGKHILIDAGGTTNFRKEKDSWKERSNPFEVGEKVVVPLLKKRGIHTLDMVMISHNHQDHSGGLQAVLDEIPVKSIVFNGTLAESKSFEQLLTTAIRQDIPIYQANGGSIYHADRYTEFLFMNMGREGREQEALPVVENQNHESLVVEMRMNQARFLFTGDVDEQAEQQILTEQTEQIAAGNTTRPLDVLKVGHHGSKTSTSEAWLEAWKPLASVISAGVNNMYRHPHPDVVDRLRSYGSFALRTDLRGEIQMRVSSNGVIDIRTKLMSDDEVH